MARAASEPPVLPGYEFVKLLGSGGFSDVFLYEQALPKRRVAVKVLLTEDLTGANRAAFVAEANLMAQLSAHPYIVTIYHADVATDDRPYFVMEYCSGPSLGDRYKQAPFEIADALRTGVRVASAVATAHTAGILHRDIKPANVLGNDYGWPALTDFGISTTVDDDAIALHTSTLAGSLTDTGTGSQSIGLSVPWSPPEMFEEDPRPDVRSDVFSLAATIYTILAGQTPFEVRGRSNGTLDLIGRIERGAITPMGRDDVPRSLLAVLHKGMASNRADRFATATDLARALQRVELELGYAPTTIEVPNLLVEAPVKPVESDAAAETRARTVSTIEAQPVFTPPPAVDAAETRLRPTAHSIVAQPEAITPEPPLDTVVRRRPDVAEPEQPVATPPIDTEPEPRTLRRNRTVAWIAAAAAAVIVAAVVTSVLVFGLPTGPVANPTSSPGGNGDPAVVVESIPTPELEGVEERDGELVFTVANPEPEDGDIFVWSRTDRTDNEPRRPEEGTEIVIEDYTAGSSVCIQVSIRRGSQVSPQPLEECYPQ